MRPLLLVLLAAALLRAADAACECNKHGNFTLSALDLPAVLYTSPTNTSKPGGDACAAPCNLTATIADPMQGIRAQVVLPPAGKGRIDVYDGSQYVHSFDHNTAALAVFPASQAQSMTFVWSGEADKYQVHIDYDIHATTTSTASTTPAQTVPPYTGNVTGLVGNPHAISVDLMLGFDCSGKDATVEHLRDLAIELIGLLNVVPKAGEGVGSRLAAHMLTSQAGYTGEIGVFWLRDGRAVQGAIKSLVESLGETPSQIQPVELNIRTGFGATNERTSAERVYMLFSSKGPSDTSTVVNFTQYGIHPILVTTGMSASDIGYFNDPKYSGANKWSIITVPDAPPSPATLRDLLNGYLLTAANKACAPEQLEIDVTKGNKTIRVPANYDGLPDGKNWTTNVHYCNFQTTNLTITNGNSDATSCLTFYFETETDIDTITVFDNDRKVAKLSGYDVGGTKVEVKSGSAHVIFETDEKNVYDGFKLEAAPGKCDFSTTVL